MRSKLAVAEDKLKRLYTIVENGLTELDDILKDRVAILKADRDRAKEALDCIKLRPKSHAFDVHAIERFGKLMREKIASSPIPFRKAYIKSVVDQVEVDDHATRIVGDKATLEQVVEKRRKNIPHALLEHMDAKIDERQNSRKKVEEVRKKRYSSPL